MSKENKSTSIFKPYLLKSAGYQGGKAISEIKTQLDKIYKLSSNENPIGASPKARKALEDSITNMHIYPDRTGIRLQKALKAFYNGVLTTDQFVAANSGSEIIELIVRAFLGEGLECIISNPCFIPYRMFSEWSGAKVVDVPLTKPDFSLDVEGILTAVNDQTRLIFLTNPNNPTGTYIPKKDIDQLLTALPEHVIVVYDEVYYHFAEAADYTTALPYVQAGKKVIAINSFSKTYGLAALRIGYAYSTPELANYVRRLCRPFLLNTLCLNAAVAALSDQEFIQQTVQLVRSEKRRLYPQFDKLGILYWKAEGNFVMLKPTIPAEKFTDLLLEEGIMVRPVANFGAPGCVRITVGDREANDALLQALQRVFNIHSS